MVGALATALTLVGLWLNGRQSMSCWPVWILSNWVWIAHWVLVYLGGGTWELSSVVLNVILLGLNAQGWVAWRDAKRMDPGG